MASYLTRTDYLQRLKTREFILQNPNGSYPAPGTVPYFSDASGTFGPSSVTLDASGNLSAAAGRFTTLTVSGNADISGVIYTATDASGNFMYIQDNSGSNMLYSYNGILYYNDTELGIPTDISSVSDWAFYPAATVVNVNGQGLTGASYITGGTATLGDLYTSAQNIHIGRNAGLTGQSSTAVAIGFGAGTTGQKQNAIAIGNQAGSAQQKAGCVAIGYQAGLNGQGGGSGNAVAIGSLTGNNQNAFAVAIGNGAGNLNQGTACVAIGNGAGAAGQLTDAIAIGNNAGNQAQGSGSISVGNLAGQSNQGANSIAIGNRAGISGQDANSIVLNATGTAFNSTGPGFFVAPVRSRVSTAGASLLYIDDVTGEIFRSP